MESQNGLEGILKFIQFRSTPAMGRHTSHETRLLFCTAEQRQKSDFKDRNVQQSADSVCESVCV